MSKNKQPDNLEAARVMLWTYEHEPGIYWDLPFGGGPGYRKPKKYNESDKRKLEKNIGEKVLVIGE